ncbi:hypothetical protein MPER_16249, partial [Moniliophthora perniciosa FA553]
RRKYEVYCDSGEVDSSKSCSFKAGANPTTVVVTHGLSLEGEKAIERWIDEARFKDTEGWLRTRVICCVENLTIGVSVPKSDEARRVPEWHVVHERSSLANPNTGPEAEDMRTWELYKAYPSIAQGNVA